MAKYTYTIFDASSACSCPYALPAYYDIEITADSDADASETVRQKLSKAVAECRMEDGYYPGDRLYAFVWDADSREVEILTHELTHSDLGVEVEEDCLISMPTL